MFDLAQAREQFLEQFRSQGEGITAGEQHVPHLRGAFDVIDLGIIVCTGESLSGVADNARAGAIAAV